MAWSPMHGLWKDVVVGVRVQLRTPAATAVAVLTLALGIGATSVAFSVVNAFFLRPLPAHEPERLVRIYGSSPSGFEYFTVGYQDVLHMRELGFAFSGVVGEAPLPLSLGTPGATERVWGELVSSDYFSLLGTRAAFGRLLTQERDGKAGAEPAVVLSHALWQRRFGESGGVLGTSVFINGRPARIVGVAPEGFHGVTRGLHPELWLPAELEADLVPSGGARGYFALGRLRGGVGIGEARAALDLLARRLERAEPGAHRRFEALPEADGRIHPMVRGSFMGFSAVLVAVTVLLLLLACGNVAGLLLVRSAARRQEIGTRMAVGATRGRIVQQVLAEGAVLALAASAVGIALAWPATRLMSAVRLPLDWPLAFDFGLDGRVLGLSVLAVGATAVAIGLLPALDASRSDVFGLLRESAPGRPPRTHGALVTVQVALSTLLLIGGGLFLRGLEKARRADVGFDPRGLVLASVDPGLQGYSAEEARAYWRRLVDRLASLPGVESASLASAVPLELNVTETSLAPEGYTPPGDGGWPSVEFAVVDAGYFETMRTPILEGREYDARDLAPHASDVVIVNDVLARRYWPGTSAVGRRVTDRFGRLFEVAGVARHARHLTLGEEPRPQVFFPNRPTDARAMTVVVRGKGDPNLLLEDVRATVRALDERIPLYNVKTASQHMAVALAPARWGAAALNGIGLVALLLASVGLYGTLAFFVTRRTHEIGIRRALGAEGGDIVWLVARRLLAPVGIGLAGGTAMGVVGSRALTSLLYGVRTTDPVAFALAPLALLLASLIATWFPARRAVRIDPARALRYE